MESPCDVCGCTETNLIDGYYYCAECGTQDTNIRETLIEAVTLSDGVLALGSRKRIKHIPQAKKEEMTDDWYKWHILNFLLKGVANELVELGAAPSFKTKLLWVWTRYMKKFQNKADFGLTPNEEDEKEKIEHEDNTEGDEDLPMNDNYFSYDEEEEEEEEETTTRKLKVPYKADLKRINMTLVVTFLYVSLNLDKSNIQLTHLIRFIKEGRLPLLHWQKYVPKELYPKKLYYCLIFNRQWFLYSYHHILSLAMKMFKELNLGNPIVPDLRMLVDEYLKELCLPNDLKPLVLSVMHYRSYDYLDMNVKFYEVGRVPSYELYVMSHILCAMKICFGIDGNYENKLSDAVEKINEIENYPKSYNSEPTQRLFSFREWCKYIQFRKSMLWSHSLYLGSPNYSDMNDYVAFEHLSEKPDFKKSLKDEIARDILHKLPDVDIPVIPKSEFPVTTTPHKTYTRVIIDHQQDPTIKQILSEDFTQYSLKYMTEDMFLVDPDLASSKNIITGVNRHDLKESSKDFDKFKNFSSTKFGKKMVYVKDCDNHNWMKTKRPNLEHIAKTVNNTTNGEIDENETNQLASEENSEITNEVINDSITDKNGDSEKAYESDSKETIVVAEDCKVFNDLSSIIEMKIDKRRSENFLIIPEEDGNENIFDDKFEGLDVKEEEHKDPEYDETMPEMPTENEALQMPNVIVFDPENQEYRTCRDSDESSEDSIHLSPETLDRTKAINELIIHACNKYRVSIPGKYICRPKRKKYVKKIRTGPIIRPKVIGSTTQKINNMVADYNKYIEQDVFVQMSNKLQSAIMDFNKTKDVETPMEMEEPPINNYIDPHEQIDNELNNVQTLNDTTQDPILDNTIDEEYNLFDEDSDGETYAAELLPKKNPEFDEATHHISQLYIKASDAPSTSTPNIRLDPNLYKIIDKVIEDEKEGKSSSESEDRDSEEDMSLSMLQELKLLREQLTKQVQYTKKKKLKPLIKAPIPQFGYWVRHYNSYGTRLLSNRRFATEVDDVFPSTFKLVLDECADVVGHTSRFVYSSLHRVESCIKHKYAQKKRFVPTYFEKQKKKFRKCDDTL